MQFIIDWITNLSVWEIIGFAGQGLFMSRFLVQWLASEKAKKSVLPDIFWYFSLGGGLILFAYAWQKHDKVFILGQGIGIFIYLRNIWFVWTHKRAGGTE